uniref:Cadherin N-terminal domain-containing protein n=1 Tax=Xiphophorus maculatus TaxID=8083 RepID=A0A3B5Q431_XIPMA
MELTDMKKQRMDVWTSFCLRASAQIRYAVPEEVKEGSVVGNVAKDLGLDVLLLSSRRFRVVTGSNEQHTIIYFP